MDLIKDRIKNGIALRQKILEDDAFHANLYDMAKALKETISQGGKLLVCGNGGSACDSMHFAAEIVGRFQQERDPWPAIAITSDVAALTSISNDYGYEYVFCRQVKGLATPHDMVIGISTSGNSQNILAAILAAKEIGCFTGVLSGCDGGKLAELADCSVIVPSNNTARIQEIHITCIHILCELLENWLVN